MNILRVIYTFLSLELPNINTKNVRALHPLKPGWNLSLDRLKSASTSEKYILDIILKRLPVAAIAPLNQHLQLEVSMSFNFPSCTPACICNGTMSDFDFWWVPSHYLNFISFRISVMMRMLILLTRTTIRPAHLAPLFLRHSSASDIPTPYTCSR